MVVKPRTLRILRLMIAKFSVIQTNAVVDEHSFDLRCSRSRGPRTSGDEFADQTRSIGGIPTPSRATSVVRYFIDG